MKKTTTFMLPILVSLTVGATQNHDEYSKLNRYTKINTNASSAISNPLKTVMTIKFPPPVKTVGQAMDYALENSGYKLSPKQHMSKESKVLMLLPLPQSQRHLKFMSMENILKVLAGDAFSLLVDPVSRDVNFITTFQY